MKKLKNFLVATAAASALCAAPGCSMKKHYVVDNFDKYYSCAIQFSENFKSDEITLYEFGEKVAARQHSVGKDSQGKLEHKVNYEFFEGGKKIAEFSGQAWNFMMEEGNPARKMYTILQRFYEMQQCEKLLQETANK